MVPPRPKKPARQIEWLPYLMVPLVAVFQIGLIVLLVLTSHGPLSVSRAIFVGSIAVTGLVNVAGCVNWWKLLWKVRAQERRRTS